MNGAERLLAIMGAHSFNPVPRHGDLADLHVPFEELSGGWPCESRLSSALRRGERVAVAGTSGAGKSSMMAWALGPTVEGLAPIPVPISLERRDVATDPIAFMSHVVATTRDHIRDSFPSRSGRLPARRSARKRTVRTSVTPYFQQPGVSVELAMEMESVVGVPAVGSRQIVEQVQQALALLVSDDLMPVLVLDDTDKWLRRPGARADVDEIRAAFFGRVLRVVPDFMPCALVVAVHETYLADPAYLPAAAGLVEQTIVTPRLVDEVAIGQILTHRASVALGEETGVDRITAPDALEPVFEYYDGQRPRSIRDGVLQIAHTALRNACDDGAPRIERVHVSDAIADYVTV